MFEEKKEITRGRMGIMLPEKNAFEFYVRPKQQFVNQKRINQESGKAKLNKALLQIKRAKTKGTSSKDMATVKLN